MDGLVLREQGDLQGIPPTRILQHLLLETKAAPGFFWMCHLVPSTVTSQNEGKGSRVLITKQNSMFFFSTAIS